MFLVNRVCMFIFWVKKLDNMDLLELFVKFVNECINLDPSVMYGEMISIH